MLSYLIFNSSVDRGIPSLAAGPFDPAILNRRNCSTCCVQETLYFCLSSPSPHGDLHASKRSFALSLFASGAFLAKTELAITILPLLVGRNRFDGVPVLCDFSVLYAEQIVKRRLLSAERALADHKKARNSRRQAPCGPGRTSSRFLERPLPAVQNQGLRDC